MMQDTANLDVMRHAAHYNRAMAELVIEGFNLRARYSTLNRSVLDFGAGYGTFLHVLQSETRGTTLQWYAVEPEIYGLYAPKKTEVFSSLEGIPSGVLDYVYSLNVFEHISEDKEIFGKLLEKVKVGGMLFILVPAHMELWTAMDARVGHLRRYTPSTLEALTQRPNLSLIAKGNFDAIGYWVAKFVAYLERIRPENKEKAGLVTEAQIKVFDYLFLLGNPVFKLIHWITGFKKAKNCWVLIKKLG